MGIFEAVSEELKTAMRNQDKERTNALRSIRAGFILGMKEDNSTTLTDENCVGILRKMVKQRQESIEAYTSGGRPELAGGALERVRAPTLLIVGGLDEMAVDLNRGAFERLRCEKSMAVLPGASRLFEEAGALEEVARRSLDWFASRLSSESA